MMAGFSESDENKGRTANAVAVVGVYVGLLRRSREQGGLDFYVNQLNSGGTLRDVLQGFFNSGEYRARFLP